MASFPAPVPKPAQAGAAQNVLARTRLSFANIRNGPGTQYQPVGELRNQTLCLSYPATRTADNWLWIEQGSMGGWVSMTVVTFENVPAPPPPVAGNPYQNGVAIWHWRGDSVPESTIEQYARSIRQVAPHVTAILVKTSDYSSTRGARWMSAWDTKAAMAIDGPAGIDRWVDTLSRIGLDFHAWAVPVGGDLNAEADLIIQACLRPGVKSMILDVEPYDGFWSAGQASIRPFMTRIRRALPANFHIGMAVDPRVQHFRTIFPNEWRPFINSIHPMAYWTTMRRDPDDVLEETYRVWGPYGLPIIPALQGDAPADEIAEARVYAISTGGAKGLSWWRAGVIGPVEWNAINKPMSDATPPKPTPPDIMYGESQVIKPGEAGYNDFSYSGQRELVEFTNTWGWKAFYTSTQTRASRSAARWAPTISKVAKYEVSVFVPGRHSSTTNARYRIHGVTGTSSEVVVPVNQSQVSNQWVTLGVFDLDPRSINAGTVFLNDLTGEDGKEIAFDAVRWQEVIYVDPGDGGSVPEGYADGYDQPVGTDAERSGTTVWAGKWYNASTFAKLYFVGTPSEAYHTGADLNLPGDGDARSPVYAAASGLVTFAGRLPIWGNVIIIRHDPLVGSGTVMYSRYGHVENMRVAFNDRVTRGQQIASVGNAFGRFAFHLHYDLSPTNVLKDNPQDWPGKKLDRLLKNYVDPEIFIRQNRPKKR